MTVKCCVCNLKALGPDLDQRYWCINIDCTEHFRFFLVPGSIKIETREKRLIVIGQWFNGVEVDLEGKTFIKCRFDKCTLISKTDDYLMVNCLVDNECVPSFKSFEFECIADSHTTNSVYVTGSKASVASFFERFLDLAQSV